jgi:hypothetical protein
MSSKLILYFTAAGHALFVRSQRGLELEATFAADDQGLEQFREALKRHGGSLAYVVADLAGEDFHEEQIPYLRGGDRQAVVQRRLLQRYRDTRLAVALTLGFVEGERRNERLLLASFTNTQQFAPWLDALSEAGTKLSGVYSVPLLAPALAARLGARRGRCFLVTATSAGLRQCYVEDGRLRFARLERLGEMRPEALAAFVRSETLRLAQYLGTLRAMPRDGTPVDVLVVAPDAQVAAFQQALVSDSRLAFRTVGMADAARKAGLKATPSGSTAEELFLQIAVRGAPKDQFARTEERRSFILWKLQRAVLAAGALGFAACALYAGMKWFDVFSVREEIAAARRGAQDARSQHQRITAAFPVTQTTSENLKAAVQEFQKIAARTATPEPALVHLSRVLEQFPQIELDSVAWTVEGPAERRDSRSAAAVPAKPAAAAVGAPAASATLLVEVQGRVQATQRGDYRTITAHVQRFASALAADRNYEIVHTQLPFDITPEGTLSGDIGETAERGEAPRFTIGIGRRLQ